MNQTAQNLDSAPLVDETYYAAVTEAIRAEAAQLLADGRVAAVIGYVAGRRAGSALPAVITTPERAGELIFSPACRNNLSVYLTKPKQDAVPKGKLAIVVKGCDLRALAGLLGESQIRRENLHIIGIACAGVFAANVDQNLPLSEATIAKKCRECTVHLPKEVDFMAGTLPMLPQLAPVEAEELARLEALTPAERWAFWKEQFSRCIRCLACRQVCPFCFCTQCLCDRNRPQTVENSVRPAGNLSWHIVRAMHLAGRCAGCAECERACPMDIPLNLLNRKMAEELKERFDYEAGLSPQEKGPLTSYQEDDDESFIK